MAEFGKGHDFSRAARLQKKFRALLPEVSCACLALLNQSMQAHGQASENERHRDQYETRLEESPLDIVHAPIILRQSKRFAITNARPRQPRPPQPIGVPEPRP